MDTSPFFLNDINDYLQNELAASRYPDAEKGGIYYPSKRPIRRLGLALEPFPKLSDWVNETQVDALWLHRPWQLDLANLPPDIGILSHHLPFDETLTMGNNTQLAKRIGATGALEPLGYKQDTTEDGTLLPERPIGMLIDVVEQEFDYWLTTVKGIFGGYDRAEAGSGAAGWQTTSSRIAVVGAMTDALVREAAERGAHLYLTGSYRKPGQQAVDETGIAVIAVGHRRSEVWGLRALADLLGERWSIECIVHEPTVISKL
ncbi:Nif3-like dinuclear metal center hexameric protein [Spirosoma flavum]|uniref:Nif3-like dinuclear metal center hexameric protein n=1 Tax=Spirosoma flavum TaxID=2048557 RepID=A0ABW6AKE6_9BACT